ncbi:ferredoxin--NADP reductase [Rickettsiella endosymbiont of Dermanyssus gallinae]|uniref:ferredoxin--NADP reductase n=1 Tax=Rickettsiella endosymbiont of Dermanyssus gallinae TaxID=2856608 RepID=UPI001C530D46|nr:ferredoxin--NADP reductase [Rickettsiella endosymbiont of Dermanyssus gallinae]
MTKKEFTLTLQDSRQIAPAVKHFTFHREDGEACSFIPGQFITLHIPTPEKILRRSYSIANSTHEASDKIEFAASYVPEGTASDLLFTMQVGDKVTATGPFGRLVLRDDQPGRYIFVATGTGITPYRTMLSELADRFKQRPGFKVVLLFGVRKPEDLLYRDEFTAFAQKNSWFEFRAYYSRIKLEQRLPYEYEGRVLNAFNEIEPNPKQDIVYLCGNPNMVDEVFSLLINTHSFPSEIIRREKYISSN